MLTKTKSSRKKKTEPVVVVVEDNDEWRDQLVMMYSRLLRGYKNHGDSSYHPSVKYFATAKEAIEYFKSKSNGRSNSKPKVDILSLDLNLGKGGHGFDVLAAAVNAGQKFVTIAVSGFANDKDLHNQLGKKSADLIHLETKVSEMTKAKCVLFAKHIQDLGSVPDQANAIEKKLRSSVHGNSNVLREWCAELRNTAADLNGKMMCLHFVLPPELFCAESPVDWVPGVITRKTRPYLASIQAWHATFEELDEHADGSDLLTRLLFLITEGTNYLEGISLQSKSDLIDASTGTHSDPPPTNKWLVPRRGVKKLTPRESFLLLQLAFKKQAQGGSTARIPVGHVDEDGNLQNVRLQDSGVTDELIVSGLLDGKHLKRANGDLLGNGDSLMIERFVAGKEDGALKSTKSLLNKKLRDILGVEYDLISAVGDRQDEKSYRLELDCFVYVQVDQS